MTTEQQSQQTPEQLAANKMQTANTILQSFFKLKDCTCEYEKAFIVKGMSLSFEYLGRLELSRMQQEMVAAQAAEQSSDSQQSADDSSTSVENSDSENASASEVAPENG